MPTIRQDSPEEVAKRLESSLRRSAHDATPVVLMTCGIAGSGKTSLAKAILQACPNFKRLSNDEIIASRHGIYNIDYEASKYEDFQNEADEIFEQSLKDMLAKGEHDVILDRSFYAKVDREAYKKLIRDAGARWILIYLKVPENILWQRIQIRRGKGINANSALEISKELFESYIKGFEHPSDEGEIVVEYTN